LISSCLPVYAAGVVSPGAGTILQQVSPVERPVPAFKERGMAIEPEQVQRLPATAPFLARTIVIIGNTQFDTLTLHSLVLDAEGKSLSAEQQVELAQRITDYYHNHGFFMARAIVSDKPALEGQVVIEVIEAKYGRISLKNGSSASDDLLLDSLSYLKKSEPIEQDKLDKSMILLSDIPGVTATPSWKKPGAAASVWWDLDVDVEPSRYVSGYTSIDDYGNSYNGKTRFYGAVNLINPLHHGDYFTASILSSGRRMNYGYISYEYLLNGIGTRAGGSYSSLHYILGDEYEPFGEHGTAQVQSIWIRHSMIRSRETNFYGQLEYDRKHLSDIGDKISPFENDRHLSDLSLYLYGDTQESLIKGGYDTWSVGMILGSVSFDDATTSQQDLQTADTQAGFFKMTIYLTSLQTINQNNSLYLAYYSQWTDGNMDASEKMVGGGPFTVRGYDMSVLLADTGFRATMELRHDFSETWTGKYQAFAFIDTEHLVYDKRPWGVWKNDAVLTGAGVGLGWTGPNQWYGKISVAKPVGSVPEAVINPPSVRVWGEISKEF